MARKKGGTAHFESILFGTHGATPTPAAPRGTTLFVYDQRVLGGEAGLWLSQHQARPANVRGRLLRGPRRRYGLVPGPQGVVRGVVIDVAPEQLPVLDFVAGGGPFRRQAIEAFVNLVPTPAQTWVLTDERGYGPLARRP